MEKGTPSSPVDNQVVPLSMKLGPVDKYRDYGSERNDFEIISSLGDRATGDAPSSLDAVLHPVSHTSNNSLQDDISQKLRAITPAPLFVPTIVPTRRGTPSRVKSHEKDTASSERRNLISSKFPARQIDWLRSDRWGQSAFSKQNNQIQSFWRRFRSSRCYLFLISKFKSFIAYFGPGLTLALAVYLTYFIGSAVSFSSGDTTTTSIAVYNDYGDNNDPQSQLKPEEQVALKEICCTGTNQVPDFCTNIPSQIINLTDQCHSKDQEYQEKIQILEQKLINLSQQFNETKALEKSKLRRLIRAVANFRLENFCALKTTVYEYLLASVIPTILLTCLFVQYFKHHVKVIFY